MVENSLGLRHPRPPVAPEQNHDGLIERLLASTGPNRDTDALIAAAVEPHIFDAPGFAQVRPVPAFRIEAEGVLRFDGGGIMCLSFIPAYTASIDAAVKLAAAVLPGWYWGVTQGDDGASASEFQGNVWPGTQPYPSDNEQYGYHATPAIALCVAILMAHGATNG